MGTLRRMCATVPQPLELQFRVVRVVGRDIAVLDGMGVHVAQREGEVLFPIFTIVNDIGSPTVKSFRFVCENLTTFPFGKRIVGQLDSWAFLVIYSVSTSKMGFMRN